MIINFYGDVMLGRDVSKALSKKINPISGIYENKGHVNICNLEAPIVDEPNNKDRLYAYLDALSIIKFFYGVSLANNHILDQGEYGLASTINMLNENKIKYTGAGLNKDEAFLPIIISDVTFNVVILGLTSTKNISVQDSNLTEKIALIEDTTYIEKFISTYKKNSNILVVMPHMGVEHIDAPNPNIVKLYRGLIEQGFDYVIGSHPHTVQGFEQYKSGLIYYSLGDLVFDNFSKYRSRSLVVKILIKSLSENETIHDLYRRDKNYKLIKLKFKFTRDYINRVNKYINNRLAYRLRFICGKLYNQFYTLCNETRHNGIIGMIKHIKGKLRLILTR